VEHGGLNDATKHSVTESTELNPGSQQPFLFDNMSSAAKTPAAKKSAAKKAVKSPKKNINRQHQSKVKISSFIYQKKTSPFKGYQIFSRRILKCCASVKKA
jgi:hypothetical protein